MPISSSRMTSGVLVRIAWQSMDVTLVCSVLRKQLHSFEPGEVKHLTNPASKPRPLTSTPMRHYTATCLPALGAPAEAIPAVCDSAEAPGHSPVTQCISAEARLGHRHCPSLQGRAVPCHHRQHPGRFPVRFKRVTTTGNLVQ